MLSAFVCHWMGSWTFWPLGMAMSCNTNIFSLWLSDFLANMKSRWFLAFGSICRHTTLYHHWMSDTKLVSWEKSLILINESTRQLWPFEHEFLSFISPTFSWRSSRISSSDFSSRYHFIYITHLYVSPIK